MKNVIGPLVVVLLLSASVSLAQKTQRGTIRRKPPTTATPQSTPVPATPTATATPQPKPSKPSTPVPLVTVNGQTISTADLDPSLRTQLENVEDRIAAAKRNVLDLQINTILLETEAKRRRITSHELYELEVTHRIPTPTPAQVKQFLEDNKDQFQGVDPATAVLISGLVNLS